MRHRPALAATAMVIAWLLTACSVVNVAPPGSREWRIIVENLDAAPARLMVAEDEAPIGELVGTAEPATVAPGATQEVVFTVPPGDGWAIFVNPSPLNGPLILARDVPADVTGALPLKIGIGADGQIFVESPGDLGPGWMGE